MDLTPYKLTVAAIILVTLLSAAVIEVVGTTSQAAGFLAIAAPTVTSLLGLFRSEQNAKAIKTAKNELAESHAIQTSSLDIKISELSELTNGISERAEGRARLEGELAGRDFEAAKLLSGVVPSDAASGHAPAADHDPQEHEHAR